MALLPLSATFHGDLLTLLVAVDDHDTASTVAGTIAHHVVGRRVAPQPAPIKVRHNGRVLPPDHPITNAGIHPLDHVEAFFDA
jgi:toluene monooxygenase system protein B